MNLEPDVSAAVDEFRRHTGAGLSDAVNSLVRRGMAAGRQRPDYHHPTFDLGLRMDITDVGEVLETIEDED